MIPLALAGTLALAMPPLALASSVDAEPAPAADSTTGEAPDAVPDPVELRKTMKARAKEHDGDQRKYYLKNIVPNSAAEALEGDMIKMHSAREWYLLTYPTGTLPPQPWDRAKAHVRRHVPDAAPWAGKSVELGGGTYSWAQKATITPNSNTWVAAGPRPLDSVGTTNNAYTYGTVTGRVGAEALASDPSNPSVAYAGFVAGGLWKTTNLGSGNVTWTPLWDDEDVVTQSVSAIELDPNDPSTIYVGTGDWAAGDQFGAGLMKSTDGGATWSQIGGDVFTPYSATMPVGGNRWSNQNVKTIRVDPKSSSTVLVGTRYDLYLSNDAGATWQICPFGANYTDPTQGVGSAITVNRVSDIVLDDRGASTVAYVAIGYIAYNGNGNNGVYRFTVPSSGCPTWPADFELLNGGFPTGTGNGVNYDSGGSITGRIELADAIGPDGDLTLVAQVSHANSLDVEGTYVLRPDGGSTTWAKLSGSGPSGYTECDGSAGSTGQDWYDLFVAVDPSDDKTLYVGHIDIYKGTIDSSYTSVSFTNLTNVYATGCPEYGIVHPDQHAFAWVEGSNGSAFLVGNDGGVYYNGNSGDALSFQQINDDFNTTQFYGGQIGADFAGNGQGGVQWLFGGMQDNGNASWDSSTADATWTARSVGGDGFYTSFDPINGTETAGWWITEYVYGDMYCSDTGAQGPYTGANVFSGCGPNYSGSPDWSTPFLIDTLNCNTSSGCSNYVVGGDYVYAASGYGRNSPSWSRISGNLVRTGSIATVHVAPSSPGAIAAGTNDGKAWWTPNGFQGTSCTAAAANTSSFSCSTNTGATWYDVDANNLVLPNRAIGQVAFDPVDHTRFYAAVLGFDVNTPSTPGHLFEARWNGSGFDVTDKTGNLPDVPASSVAVNPHNPSQVFVGTYLGFYYTDDIDASPVQWVRYDEGLPTTVIKHLTIDRGPASNPKLGTTLAAFTYGRGVYVLGLPTGPTNAAPTADFRFACTLLACNFTDASSDSDGSIASWSWDFGDGATSSVQSPSHSYGANGSYTVTLTVTDDGGATDSISQTVPVSDGTNAAPTAAFSTSCTDLGCSFTDASSDSDGSIASWSWSFGDGATSTVQSPSHTYAAAGTYTVTLTVTDDGGATGSTSQSVTVTAPAANITLTANGYKAKGAHTIDLSWSGATSTNVDIYRGGSLLVTTPNDGAYTDATSNKGSGSYSYQVCAAGTSTCSNTETVVF